MTGEKETSSKAIMITEGHAFIHVRNLERALEFYKDIVGIDVKRSESEWVDLAPILGISLSRGDEELIEFHVDDFEEAAVRLENAGVKVKRKSKHGGRVTDPFGNVIGIHDHRK